MSIKTLELETHVPDFCASNLFWIDTSQVCKRTISHNVGMFRVKRVYYIKDENIPMHDLSRQ